MADETSSTGADGADGVTAEGDRTLRHLPPHEAAGQLLADFRLPPGSGLERFAAAQIHLYRHDPELQAYFLAIQRWLSGSPSPRRSPSSYPPAAAGTSPVRRSRRRGGPRRADVLVCGVWRWRRPLEDRLLERLLLGLLERDLDVLCLLEHGPRRWRLRALHDDAPPGGRLRFVDPRPFVDRLADGFGSPFDRRRRREARRVFERLRALLGEIGLELAPEALPEIEWTVAAEAAWAATADRLAFDRAIVRCHWLPLGAAVARTALARGAPVTTLQQGVVSHSIDLPIAADRMLCFGAASRRALESMDRTFAAAVGRATRCRDIVAAGSFLDPVPDLAISPLRGSGRYGPELLLIDQSADWSRAYYDLAGAEEELESGLRQLLALGSRVVVRPHPAAGPDGGRRWARLAADYPHRVALSSPGTPLEVDLESALVAVGLFSGALATAAAAGVPAYFVHAPGGFATPDLEPFADFRVDGDELVARAAPLLADVPDSAAYRRVAEAAREAARGYYADFRPAFDDAFFDRLLAPADAGR